MVERSSTLLLAFQAALWGVDHCSSASDGLMTPAVPTHGVTDHSFCRNSVKFDPMGSPLSHFLFSNWGVPSVDDRNRRVPSRTTPRRGGG